MPSITSGVFFVALLTTGLAINCHVCNSNQHSHCTEFFDEEFEAKPSNCSSVFEARYCIKTTGMYDGERGTKRFCSSRDMGNHCDYVSRPGDVNGDETIRYRSCIYTCTTDGCNHSCNLQQSSFVVIVIASLVISTMYR